MLPIGLVLNKFGHSVITPVLIACNFSTSDISNYRPISTIPIVAKILKLVNVLNYKTKLIFMIINLVLLMKEVVIRPSLLFIKLFLILEKGTVMFKFSLDEKKNF